MADSNVKSISRKVRAGKSNAGRKFNPTITDAKKNADCYVLIDGANVVTDVAAANVPLDDAKLLAGFFEQAQTAYDRLHGHADVKIYMPQHMYCALRGKRKLPPRRVFEFGIDTSISIHVLMWRDAIRLLIEDDKATNDEIGMPGDDSEQRPSQDSSANQRRIIIMSNKRFPQIEVAKLYTEAVHKLGTENVKPAWRNATEEALKDTIQLAQFTVREEAIGPFVFADSLSYSQMLTEAIETVEAKMQKRKEGNSTLNRRQTEVEYRKAIEQSEMQDHTIETLRAQVRCQSAELQWWRDECRRLHVLLQRTQRDSDGKNASPAMDGDIENEMPHRSSTISSSEMKGCSGMKPGAKNRTPPKRNEVFASGRKSSGTKTYFHSYSLHSDTLSEWASCDEDETNLSGGRYQLSHGEHNDWPSSGSHRRESVEYPEDAAYEKDTVVDEDWVPQDWSPRAVVAKGSPFERYHPRPVDISHDYAGDFHGKGYIHQNPYGGFHPNPPFEHGQLYPDPHNYNSHGYLRHESVSLDNTDSALGSCSTEKPLTPQDERTLSLMSDDIPPPPPPESEPMTLPLQKYLYGPEVPLNGQFHQDHRLPSYHNGHGPPHGAPNGPSSSHSSNRMHMPQCQPGGPPHGPNLEEYPPAHYGEMHSHPEHYSGMYPMQQFPVEHPHYHAEHHDAIHPEDLLMRGHHGMPGLHRAAEQSEHQYHADHVAPLPLCEESATTGTVTRGSDPADKENSNKAATSSSKQGLTLPIPITESNRYMPPGIPLDYDENTSAMPSTYVENPINAAPVEHLPVPGTEHRPVSSMEYHHSSVEHVRLHGNIERVPSHGHVEQLSLDSQVQRTQTASSYQSGPSYQPGQCSFRAEHPSYHAEQSSFHTNHHGDGSYPDNGDRRFYSLVEHLPETPSYPDYQKTGQYSDYQKNCQDYRQQGDYQYPDHQRDYRYQDHKQQSKHQYHDQDYYQNHKGGYSRPDAMHAGSGGTYAAPGGVKQRRNSVSSTQSHPKRGARPPSQRKASNSISFETCVRERRLSNESLGYYRSLLEGGRKKVRKNFRHTLHDSVDDVDHHFLRFACITKHSLDRERNDKPDDFVIIAKIIDQLEIDQLRWLFHFFKNDPNSTILDQIRSVARKLHFDNEWQSHIPKIQEVLRSEAMVQIQ